ncbi:hypothetical protein XM38_022050 [Halomicronema hongdechloris C2206]|uniref:DM13 domain-containing protein n=1 Tax=Halomicronema hongdechloris C2206 TaxID=1641165 RepID=A0A1Z3HLS1_9CYAN|nr:DM13 domain-containing protein [Halomicronema hongdechloris]ASC71253.1 hypothetical protein XM38_022050 [Halomicronema hongdechloris C2206]
MSRTHLVAYGLIAGVTPVLVLVNSLLGPARMSSMSVQRFRSMATSGQRLIQDPVDRLGVAYTVMSRASTSYPQARIVTEKGQLFLELYQPFTMPSQTPSLMLILDRAAVPRGEHPPLDDSVVLGELHASAGMQRYPIPESVEIRQYLSVMIWCPDLDAIMGYAPLTFAV